MRVKLCRKAFNAKLILERNWPVKIFIRTSNHEKSPSFSVKIFNFGVYRKTNALNNSAQHVKSDSNESVLVQ